MVLITPKDITGQVSPTPPKQLSTTEAPLEKSEPSKEAASEATDKDKADFLSPKFAALARREKAVRQRLKDIEAREAALKTREGQSSQPSQEDWREKIKKDPFGALSEAGMTLDEMTQLMMNPPKPEDQKLRQLQAEIERLKKMTEESQTNAQKAEQDRYEQAKKHLRTQVDQLLQAELDAFENIKGDEAQDAVVALIEETFKSEGYVMDVKKAAQEVEDHLTNLYLERAKRKAIQSKLSPQPTPQADEKNEAQKPDTTQKQPAMTTLSNRTAVSSSKPLTPRERRERAIMAFQGKLQ